MKTNRIAIRWIGAAAAILTLAGCADISGPGPGGKDSIPDGKGLARIYLGGSGERTAVPDQGGYYFTLQFTAPGQTDVVETLAGGFSLTVALDPGTWDLEVKGYADSGMTVLKARGGRSIAIIPGIIAQFEVYLTPVFSAGETGTLSYSIALPVTVSRGFLSLSPLNAPGTKANPAGSREIDISTGAGGTATGSLNNLPEGSYRAQIDLYDGGSNKAAVRTDAVHIHGGLATPLTYVFTGSDFAGCDPLVGQSASTLAAKLDAALGSPEGAYTIVLNGAETDLASFNPKTLSVTGKNIAVTIRGNGREVQLGGDGCLFTLSNLTLALHDVTLRGKSGNTASLIRLNSKARLEMEPGTLITGNSFSSSSYSFIGGGVHVDSSGIFYMNGGAVRGNSARYRGGGVSVFSGTFAMSGGEVSDNGGVYCGGGVHIESGTFDMSGGAVSGNFSSHFAGGVNVDSSGIFYMNGGAVSGNSSTSGGGVRSVGTFDMRGGAVSGNSSGDGGGVSVSYQATFYMSGGEVSGNIISGLHPGHGGGVYVSSGTFVMSGGEVSGNIISDIAGYGYGREVAVDGTFKLSGDARPERVFLYADHYIAIAGPLSGGTVSVDLGSVTDWVGQRILLNYPSGDMASLKTHFTLGNYSSHETPIPTGPGGYKLDNGGYFVAY